MPNKISLDDMKILIEKIHALSDGQKLTETESVLTQAEEVIRGFSNLKSNDEIKVIGDLLSILATNPICHKFAAHVDPGVFKQFGKELVLQNFRNANPCLS